ncbi:putative membrane-anchored protein [Psychromicrobium silvestre]|uniref:Putative membrane-anchored protein n=1 Tax=Psychromicrobium silvestre TaxID=1645614 RepID=A0A7Y9LTR7_9MICC|nr:hypothetical protein [Psychromicrobium silvestre]NYE95414.1 putative membrane-anchored protein [Psychromicrobium silvestre]
MAGAANPDRLEADTSTTHEPGGPLNQGRSLAIKVPEVTALFWIVKVLTTGMGETASDFFAQTVDPVIAVGATGVVLLLALVLQFRTKRYVPAAYWFAVVMVSVFGTMAADVLHVVIGIPYTVSTVLFLVILAAIFLLWRRVEGTLSIHSIDTSRREAFYWLTVLTTFALGTAAGDLTATTFHWGYLGSGIVYALIIAVPGIAFWKFRLNAVFAFWFAYILTRPLGASFADWLAVTPERGGLNWGTGQVTIALAILIILLVGYLALKRQKKPLT